MDIDVGVSYQSDKLVMNKVRSMYVLSTSYVSYAKYMWSVWDTPYAGY